MKSEGWQHYQFMLFMIANNMSNLLAAKMTLPPDYEAAKMHNKRVRSLITGEFHSQRPVTRSFDVFFLSPPEQTAE